MFVITLHELAGLIKRLINAAGRVLLILFGMFTAYCVFCVPKYSPEWYAWKEFLEIAIPIVFVLLIFIGIILGIFKWLFGP